MKIKDNRELRIAWLLPIAWYYWHPALSEFTKAFPQTKIFTGLFPGYAKGYEDSILVDAIGNLKNISLAKNESSYDTTVTYLSLKIVPSLLKFQPDIIFTSSFGIWTILALGLKLFCGWQVIIAYEGSSPGVDYCNSPLRLWLRKIMVRLSDACLSNSQRGKKYLVEILKADPKSTFVQPYEIPSAKTLSVDIAETSSPSELQRPVFLFVGHLIPRKGINNLLQACKILKDRGYENYTLQIVGSGEEKAKLASYCQEHQLNNNLQWLGRVEYSAIATYFKNADVFVFPTWEETWGVVLLEAMLFGKPTICSTGAGTSEMVVDGENGYLFDPNRADKLAELMGKFIDNYDLIESMGKKSQATMSLYTPEAAGKALTSIVESLADKKCLYA